MSLPRGSGKSLGLMLLSGTVKLIGGRLARMLITVTGIAVLARLLTPADFGVAAVAAMILPLANSLLNGLIDVPTIREDTLDREELRNLIWSGAILMSAISAGLWLAAPALAALLNSPMLSDVLRLMCFGLLFQPFITASNALLRRGHRFGLSAIFIPVSGAVYVIFAVALALLNFGVWSLIIGQISSLIFSAVGLALLSGIPLAPPQHLKIISAWKLGGLGLATRLLAWIASNLDTLFASAALGAADAGIYSRAYNLTTQLKSPFEAFDQTVRQAFLAQRSGDAIAASKNTMRGLRLIVLIASVVSAGVIVLREPLVAVMLGQRWDAVVMPLAILTASLPARIARLYLDGLAYARGSIQHMLWRNVIVVTLMTVGLYLWAFDGVDAIALVVAAVHLLSIILPSGRIDATLGGTAAQRLSAIAPGYIVGVTLVVLAELPTMFWSNLSSGSDWIIRSLVLLLFLSFFVPVFLKHLLPPSFKTKWVRK